MDTLPTDLKSFGATHRVGSTPTPGTNLFNDLRHFTLSIPVLLRDTMDHFLDHFLIRVHTDEQLCDAS